MEVVLDWEGLRLMMEVLHRRCSVAAGDYPKAVVLHRLKFAEMCRLQVGRVDGRCEVGNGGSQRFVR